MIVDERVFADDHLPQQILHRECETASLLRALGPTTEPRRGDAIIYGPSGVGKTALTRSTVHRLSEERSVQTAHVRCLGASVATVARKVLEQLPGPNPAMNTPQEDLCLMLRERVDEPLVVVLDEGDDLARTEVLPRLFDVPQISVVLVCHDVDSWLAAADPTVRGRLSGTEIRLRRYGVDALADILEERARVGLVKDAVRRRVLEAIADEVAGVARDGIQTLRAAAELADRRERDRIGADFIDEAHEEAKRRIREHNLASLPLHHQVVYELLRVEDGLRGGELHERYDQVAEDVYAGRPLTPVNKGSRRRHLRKLRDYDLVEAVGENRNRVYQVLDERVKPAVALDLSTRTESSST